MKRIWILLAVVLILFSSCFVAKTGIDAAKGVVTKTINADNIINNYQWFYDQYYAIQAQIANIEASNTPVERQGMIMVVNKAIGEYNSKSMQINRNSWKAKDLPHTITLYTGGSK